MITITIIDLKFDANRNETAIWFKSQDDTSFENTTYFTEVRPGVITPEQAVEVVKILETTKDTPVTLAI